jgi:hypothetical protein
MTEKERQLMREYVNTWKTTGPILERLRREDVRNANTTEAILVLNDAFESARLHYPPKPTSGLVAQQAIFMRARQKNSLS